MRGEVRQSATGRLEPWLTIEVETADGTLYSVEALMDTGFTDGLVLPEAVIRHIGLTTSGQTQVVLATGAVSSVEYCRTRVFWHGSPVVVFQSQDQSLLGMHLLSGNVLTMQAWNGGQVTIAEPASESELTTISERS